MVKCGIYFIYLSYDTRLVENALVLFGFGFGWPTAAVLCAGFCPIVFFLTCISVEHGDTNFQYNEWYMIILPWLYPWQSLLARTSVIGTSMLLWSLGPKIGFTVPMEGVWI